MSAEIKKSIPCFIFARGGSKGLKDKNLRTVGGISLIDRAIDTALSSPSVGRVFVSTDSDVIAARSLERGAEVPFMRPASLSRDQTPEIEAWRHAIRWMINNEKMSSDVMLSLPPTAPLRSVEDVENSLGLFVENRPDLVICTTESQRSPYFNMMEERDGFLKLIKGGRRISRRQDTPLSFDITTVAYVVSMRYALTCESLFSGRVLGNIVPKERAIDIDDEIDLVIANALAQYEH